MYVVIFENYEENRRIERHRLRLEDNIKRNLKDRYSNKCAKFKYTPLAPEWGIYILCS
jgi:hypothetical protein